MFLVEPGASGSFHDALTTYTHDDVPVRGGHQSGLYPRDYFCFGRAYMLSLYGLVVWYGTERGLFGLWELLDSFKNCVLCIVYNLLYMYMPMPYGSRLNEPLKLCVCLSHLTSRILKIRSRTQQATDAGSLKLMNCSVAEIQHSSQAMGGNKAFLQHFVFYAIHMSLRPTPIPCIMLLHLVRMRKGKPWLQVTHLYPDFYTRSPIRRGEMTFLAFGLCLCALLPLCRVTTWVNMCICSMLRLRVLE